jgi:hypothetical protein
MVPDREDQGLDIGTPARFVCQGSHRVVNHRVVKMSAGIASALTP